jgi:hypothetical protein
MWSVASATPADRGAEGLNERQARGLSRFALTWSRGAAANSFMLPFAIRLKVGLSLFLFAPLAAAQDASPEAAPPSTPPPVIVPAAAAAPAAPAAPTPPAVVADPPPEPPAESAVALKVYGDTLFQFQNHGPVKTTFEAAHVDLFLTADVGKLSFLSEVFFEGRDTNEIAVDVERLQVSYLFENWLRVRAGRSHTAFGYYNDTYHHGNLFELTTQRPFGVGFEDQGGLFTAHLVGVGADGTIEAGAAGAFRYDAEIGNGRLGDPSAVAIVKAGKTEKMANLRLRWLTPIDGLIIGVNGVYDLVPEVDATATEPARRKVIEGIAGAHVVYMEHDVHLLLEGYVVHHERSGGGVFDTTGGFAELGYAFGKFTPYVRPEIIVFPKDGDPVYQQAGAFWAGASSVFDARVGVRWLAMPQLAIKLEAERLARGDGPQELITTKLAFGF